MESNDISRILKLDRSLREQLSEAEKKRDEIDESIDRKIKELHENYQLESKAEIDKYNAKKNDETNAIIAEQNARYKKQLDVINSKYESDKEKWLSHIVGAVTEV